MVLKHCATNTQQQLNILEEQNSQLHTLCEPVTGINSFMQMTFCYLSCHLFVLCKYLFLFWSVILTLWSLCNFIIEMCPLVLLFGLLKVNLAYKTKCSSVFMAGTRVEYLYFPWSKKWFIVRMIKATVYQTILVGKVLHLVAVESEVLIM